MSLVTLYLPKMGESIIEALVLNWFVQEEEFIAEGDPLLEVATDKVDAEVPAMCSGIVKKLLVQKGEVVALGAPIALLEAKDVSIADRMGPAKPFADGRAVVHAPIPMGRDTLDPMTVTSASCSGLKFSPLAKQMMQKHSIHPDELASQASLVKDSRVTKKLILDYLSRRSTELAQDWDADSGHSFDRTVIPLEGDEVIQMDRVRKLIGSRMVQSKKIAPHVTSFIRVDVTALVTWRNQHKNHFEQAYGIKLTYNPIFMAVIARALQTFPLLNAVMVGDRVIKRKNINIGFAVALPNGNLLAPVVKQVDQIDFITLAQQIFSLIHKARSGTITSDELAGASYTISNIGCFDNVMGTPIIVQPQVAILALGVIERRPAVVHRAGEERIAIRDEMWLSHTYDHRIIDGAIGGGFLQCLAKELQSFSGSTIQL